jgi:hypothetical protein
VGVRRSQKVKNRRLRSFNDTVSTLYMDGEVNSYIILIRRPNGEDHLENLGIDGVTILKRRSVLNRFEGCAPDSFGFR